MKIGEYIKVRLPFTDPEMPGCQGETPWAILRETLPDGTIKAQLANHPIATDLHGFVYMDLVHFHKAAGKWEPKPLPTALD